MQFYVEYSMQIEALLKIGNYFRLHFRPKTPPPEYEPPCDMLLSQDSFFNPSANTPFSMEIQTLDAPSSTLLDTSTFVTDPFMLNNLDLDIPVTDTRQSPINTLTSNVSDVRTDNDSSDSSDSDYRTIGCSSFNISDSCSSADWATGTRHQQKKTTSSSSTLTSPKFNSVSTSVTMLDEGHSRPRSVADNSLGNTNGLLAQFEFEGMINYCLNTTHEYFLFNFIDILFPFLRNKIKT